MQASLGGACNSMRACHGRDKPTKQFAAHSFCMSTSHRKEKKKKKATATPRPDHKRSVRWAVPCNPGQRARLRRSGGPFRDCGDGVSLISLPSSWCLSSKWVWLGCGITSKMTAQCKAMHAKPNPERVPYLSPSTKFPRDGWGLSRRARAKASERSNFHGHSRWRSPFPMHACTALGQVSRSVRVSSRLLYFFFLSLLVHAEFVPDFHFPPSPDVLEQKD